MAELALGLPALGALLVSALRRRRGAALLTGSALGMAALVAITLVPTGAVTTLFGLELRLLAPAQVVLVATFLAAGLAVLLVPPGADRVPLLASVLAGLAALAAIALVTQPLVVCLVLLLLAAGQAALPALRPFAERVRAPAFGLLLILLGALIAAGATLAPVTRVAGLALVLGVTAVIGVAPYLQRLDPREPAPASPIAWLAFIGPGLAVLLATRLAPLVPVDASPGYAAVLLAMGLFNLGLGAYGGWRSKGADLWRYSFIADWGLVLVGLGLLDPSGSQGAYLVLLTIPLLRLPLYLAARPALVRGRGVENLSPLTLLVAAALFGAAPFAGFPARLLILRAASHAPWPLTAVLAIAILSWLPQSLRLAQSMGRPRGRVVLGIAVVVVLNLALGLYPGPVLRLLGA